MTIYFRMSVVMSHITVFIVSLPANTAVSPWCATNEDWSLAEGRVNEVNIVVKCSNRVPIPKLDF